MRIAMWVAFSFALASPIGAQDSHSHHVALDLVAEDGVLHFDGYLCRSSPVWKEGVPEISGTLSGDLPIWRTVGISAVIERASGPKLKRSFIVRGGLIPWKSASVLVTLIEDITEQKAGCDITSSSLELTYAVSEASVEREATAKAAEEKQRRADEIAKANAEKKKAADAAAREAARLAKLPILHSGLQAAFLGSDRKCAEQFQQALAMDGLEKRKRIADLVSYNCGNIVGDGVHVSAVGPPSGGYRQVSVEEGRDRFKHGWIPESWIK